MCKIEKKKNTKTDTLSACGVVRASSHCRLYDARMAMKKKTTPRLSPTGERPQNQTLTALCNQANMIEQKMYIR